MSKGRVKPSLATLSREVFADGEIDRFMDELTGASDRAAAIAGAAMVERMLISVVQTKLRRLTKTESDSLFFADAAILKTFSARTQIAYCLELITQEEKNQIDAIRKVRNAFAHALRPITFENDLVKAACKGLAEFNFVEDPRTKPLSVHRRQYIGAVAGISAHFRDIVDQHPDAKHIIKLTNDPYAKS